MPLLMLAWSIGLFGVLGHPAPAAGSIAPAVAAATGAPVALLAAPATPTSPADRLPLWCEAEDEDERDDDSESAAPLAFVDPWSAAGAWSRPVARPPGASPRPCSALRSPILRC